MIRVTNSEVVDLNSAIKIRILNIIFQVPFMPQQRPNAFSEKLASSSF